MPAGRARAHRSDRTLRVLDRHLGRREQRSARHCTRTRACGNHVARAPAPGTVIQWMLKVGALRNGFTYRKLFHQLEEIVFQNFSVTYGKYLRTRTKVCQLLCFWSDCFAFDLLIELCPMVPFAAKVPHGVSQPTFA